MRAPAIALAIAVVLTGCSDDKGSGTPTPPPTPISSTPTTPETTPETTESTPPPPPPPPPSPTSAGPVTKAELSKSLALEPDLAIAKPRGTPGQYNEFIGCIADYILKGAKQTELRKYMDGDLTFVELQKFDTPANAEKVAIACATDAYDL